MSAGKVTIRAVEQLMPGATLWDTSLVGFGVRRQRKHPTYVLKYRYQGHQRFVTIGRHGAPWTPDTARREARRLLGSVESGLDPAAARDDEKANPTLAKFVDRYLTDYAEHHKRPRSVKEDRRNLTKTILPALGNKKVAALDRAIVARFHASLRDRPILANRCLALLSHIITMAEKWGVRPLNSNPCRHVDKYPERPRERPISPEELGRLGAALEAASQPDTPASEDWRAIGCIRLLLLTGARLGEILELRWDQIDWERGIARLQQSKTGAKNLPLSDAALEVIRALPQLDGSPYVLPGRRSGHFIGVQSPWGRIRTRAGLGDLRLHDLRHAFASVAVTGGDSLYVVGKILGHRQARTTERYAHLAPDPVRAAANRTAADIERFLTPIKTMGESR